MDITKAYYALEKTAQINGIGVEEVIAEINMAIKEAIGGADPKTMERWTRIPCIG